MPKTTEVERFTDFMCRCGPGDERAKHCDAVVDEVLARLSGGSEELVERSVTRDNFLSAVVMSLHWDYNATVEDIGCDMWFGVTVTSRHWDSEAPNEYTGGKGSMVEDVHVWIQCDMVEDGLAAAWKFFADRAEGNTPESGSIGHMSGDDDSKPNLTSDSEERG